MSLCLTPCAALGQPARLDWTELGGFWGAVLDGRFDPGPFLFGEGIGLNL